MKNLKLAWHFDFHSHKSVRIGHAPDFTGMAAELKRHGVERMVSFSTRAWRIRPGLNKRRQRSGRAAPGFTWATACTPKEGWRMRPAGRWISSPRPGNVEMTVRRRGNETWIILVNHGAAETTGGSWPRVIPPLPAYPVTVEARAEKMPAAVTCAGKEINR